MRKLLSLLALGSLGCGRAPELGVTDGWLTPCPSSPNCVSSQAPRSDAEHWIPPIEYRGDRDAARHDLVTVIREMPRSTVIEERDDYVRAEYRTAIFRFVDDLELYLPGDRPVVHVRSASRVGHSDRGVNRERVEALRRRFQERR